MLNVLRFIVGFAVLFIPVTVGENPLQRLLSTLECYKFTQEGCNEDFTDANEFRNCSRSYDGSSVANTRFYLFTPNNVEDPELLHKCGGKLPPKTNFNPRCRTEFTFPGFVSGACHMSIYRELIHERLKCACVNYIHVEWTWGNSFDLVTATKNMKVVAQQIAVIIRYLKVKFNLTAEDFGCVGQSLGAHGCGFVGQNENISYINGIEPAGMVYWENMPLDERLDPGDAECVQVTHTNAGQCLFTWDHFPYNFFGVNFSCGTKDFWFNDGFFQKSCYPDLVKSFLRGDFIYGLINLVPAACSHLQSLQYYKASMCAKDCQFIGVKCSNTTDFLKDKCTDCGPSGEDCDVTGAYSCDCGSGDHQNYYLKTRLLCPYCDNSKVNIDGYTCPALTLKTHKRWWEI